MKTIVHISDLHFGTEDPEIADGLIKDLKQVNPLLVINSGDFTQRARRSQFRAASEYMERIPYPQLSVPGNHDIPLFDLTRRFLSPLKRYKKYITNEMFPCFTDDNLTVIGINTARSLTWKSGRISDEQIQEMERILSSLPRDQIKIVVTHHPFIPPPGQEEAGVDLVGRAKRAIEIFERYKVDLLLAGHLHHGYTGDVRTFYPTSKRSIIVAQAGTAISDRVRHEPNGYNIITLEEDRIAIKIKRWIKSRKTFSAVSKIVFELKDDLWISHKAKDPAGSVN